MKKGQLILSSRDVKLIQFLEDTRLYLNAKQISRMWYWTGNEESSYKNCQARLGKLAQKKHVKRIRDHIDQDYVYYEAKQPPRAYDHKLMNSEFLSWLWRIEGLVIHEVIHEFTGIEKEYSIRPDLRLEVSYKGYEFVFIAEVDNRKTFTNGAKYSRLIQDIGRKDELQEIFPPGQTLFISVCNKPPQVDFPIVWIKGDMSNVNDIKRILDEVIE